VRIPPNIQIARESAADVLLLGDLDSTQIVARVLGAGQVIPTDASPPAAAAAAVGLGVAAKDVLVRTGLVRSISFFVAAAAAEPAAAAGFRGSHFCSFVS
jgi:hypothetical protein